MESQVSLQSLTVVASNKVNGSSRVYDEMNISEITSSAKDAVNRETRGATPMSMIKTARRQVQQGKDYEVRGDLKSALAAYTQAAALAKMTLDHPEMKKGGGLKKEFNDFFEVIVHISSQLIDAHD